MGTVDQKPYLVSWNLTRRCNLRCPHCYIEAVTGPQPELSTGEAKLVIDELSYLNSRLMLILSGGEPLLRDDLAEIVSYATEAGFITVLGSNGTLLTDEALDILKESGLKGMGISIDSTVPKQHDAFRGMQGAWDLSISALRAARERKIETQMDVTITDANWREIPEFIELGASLGVRAVNFFFLVCTGRAMRTDISTEHYDEALGKIAFLSARERRLMARARCAPHVNRMMYQAGTPVAEGTRGCLAGRSYIRIDHEGNVTPCPYMPLMIGNVKEQSLSSIWENAPALRRLRQEPCGGRCGICEFNVICGGCRARALAERGDFMAEDPFCSYTPKGKETVTLQDAFASDLDWEEAVKERIKKVPPFMRGIVMKLIESRARERGIRTVTSELVDELKTQGYSHARKPDG
jgi:radical SAM protein with 4Fe4S-binding SPASM domain